jgi:DNA-binding transcriptional LysR family regulator
MDTATLMIAEAVLRLKSLRGAARELHKPPGSIAASIARLEAALAVPLTRKSGSGLMLTLEGTRLASRIAVLCELVAALFQPMPATQPGVAAAVGPRQLPPRSVSLEALFRLLIVAQTGSIRAAARRLKLGQPQLTRQIAHVEQVLGQTLLARTRQGCLASDAGKGVIDTIRRIEVLWLEIAKASDERFRRAEITLRVGAVMPLGPESQIAHLLATLAARWRLGHPRQPLFITAMLAEELLDGLRRGRLDTVLLDLNSLPDDLDGQLLSASPLAVVAPRAIADLADARTILQSSPLAIPSLRSGLRQTTDLALVELLGEAGRRQLEIVEIDSIPVIINMVARHGFVSILPSVSLAALSDDLVSIPLSGRYQLQLWIAWLREGQDRRIGRQILEMMG